MMVKLGAGIGLIASGVLADISSISTTWLASGVVALIAVVWFSGQELKVIKKENLKLRNKALSLKS
ncbi:MAG: hypothetical protein K9M44_00535 [Candidatus Pacebacteria bacterium]|nr:hypothetical protein [Candidatus Paceibacterota bacterium]